MYHHIQGILTNRIHEMHIQCNIDPLRIALLSFFSWRSEIDSKFLRKYNLPKRKIVQLPFLNLI